MSSTAPDSTECKTARVLLVDDDAALLDVLEEALQGEAVALTRAGSGPEALEASQRQPCNLVLLDVGLPGADGFEILQRFRANPALRDVPVILMTARNATEDKLRGFELGAVDFVSKPFVMVEMRARVRAHLRARQLQTQLREANRVLDAARRAAEESARARADFLASMSHEIRTPMNGVIAMTGLLLNTEMAAEQRDFVETIRTSGESLLTIINDILNFSKIEAGKLELEDRPLDARACVEEALDLLAARAAEKRIDLACNFEPDAPAHIFGDVTRLRQVLVNLLGNAVKFTSRGEVTVTVRVAPLADEERAVAASAVDRCRLQFIVRDTGIGIPPDRLDRLFRSFSQADDSVSREFGGTGLGLAISKGLVELMGGRIWVESRPGEGSAFHFTLPVTPAPAPAATETAPAPSLSGRRVLLAEDNKAVREILAAYCARWGMAAVEAASVETLRAEGRKAGAADVLLLDAQLPGLDLSALLAQLPPAPAGGAIPVVLMVPVGTRLELPASAGNAVSQVNKPVKPGQLRASLAQAISGTRPAAARKTQAPGRLDGTLAARVPLQILIADDNPINQKVASRLLQQLGYKADMAGNGAEVLQALERVPYDLVLMDVQMPEMDGLEATRQIRQRQRGPAPHPHFARRVVIIAMTANAMQGDREKCLAAGMDDYVPKPIRPEALQSVIERLGAGSSARASQAPPAAASSGATGREVSVAAAPALPASPRAGADASLVDLDRLNDFAGGSLENLKELVALYLQQTSTQIGLLETALAAGDCAKAARLAHSSAGASATCGMVAILPVFRQIEHLGGAGDRIGAVALLPAARRDLDRIKHFFENYKSSALAA